MSTFLPRDDNYHPIPALRPSPAGAHAIAATTAASQRNSAAFDIATRIVTVYATGPVYFTMGDQYVTTTATGHYLPAGVYTYFSLGDSRQGQSHHTHIAVQAAESDCVVHVSEME